MPSLAQHLHMLGLDPDPVIEALPNELTLSLRDGVLFLSDNKNQNINACVDFLSGRTAHRSRQHLGGEMLIKACRIKDQAQTRVLDATCGFGRESFLLSQAHFKVTACEQHPVVAALLQDGLIRYQNMHQHQPFKLLATDALSVMARQQHDVVYLDPMFPERQKSALVKKDMQLFHRLHGHIDDALPVLFQAAQKCAVKKVVVKRPTKAPCVLVQKPTYQLTGKSCRFDVYQQ